MRILAKGWNAIYLPVETPGEVPVTLRAFLRQQMRWCFGGVRVFLDHAHLIARSPALRLHQRLFIAYLALGNIVAVPVAFMTLTGLASWLAVGVAYLGGRRFAGLDGRIGIACALGFLLVAAIALHRRKKLHDLPWAAVGACTVALPLALANAVASMRALVSARRPLYGGGTSWICTPKVGNSSYQQT